MALRDRLTHVGHDVQVASDGTTALSLATRWQPELVVLDLDLPDMPGLQLARELRAVSDLPIIVLTARAQLAQTIALLAVDVDDHLIKPCAPAELDARIARRLRPALGARSVKVGRLSLDGSAHLAHFADQALHLTPMEFELLALLARAPERVYSRGEIAWGLSHRPSLRGRNVIEGHVAGLRHKLRCAGADGLLQTAHRLGYRLHVS